MQLVIAMMLLWERFGNRVCACGGDTDSIKVRCDSDVTSSDIIDALEPLHKAITGAISLSMTRLRKTHPDKASTLDNVGCFEIERAKGSKSEFYRWHMEAWNKARISVTEEGEPHVTCAGLSRPSGAYTLETWLADMHGAGWSWERLLPLALGYNVTYTNAICHALEHDKPLFSDMFHGTVTDYKGDAMDVCTHAAIALHPTNRKMGDTLKNVNLANVAWLHDVCGRDVDTYERVCDVSFDESGNATPMIYQQTEFGMEVMEP